MPNRPDTLHGFVMAHGEPDHRGGLRGERRFSVPAAYRAARAGQRHCRCRCRTAAAASALLAVRSRKPQRFGDDEVHFLQSLSNLLASSLQRAEIGRGARTMRSGWKASGS